ncbi:MAG: hypothetical protein KC445_17050, partial [Anaerolineales bacterium]|nr:hypothetical protein [Anaerolineales bacterium]
MKKKKELTEAEIDELVVAQADDDMVWDEAVIVERDSAATVFLPPELASRAAFFAQLHNMPVAAWLERIIQERLAFEESAFAGLNTSLNKFFALVI